MKSRWICAGLLLPALWLAGCGRDSGDAGQAPRAVAAGNGVIRGRVVFAGNPPYVKIIPGSPLVKDESIVVGRDGGLKNVIVYLKDAPRPTFVLDTPVVLDQINCVYVPHVVAVQTGQTLRLKSSDKMMHNVHLKCAVNPDQNYGFSGPGQRDITLASAEAPFAVKCDVHPWMTAWVGAFDHPWFAVTGEDGSFTITHVPPGKYTLVAWQEVLPQQEQEVSVSDTAPAEADFHFSRLEAMDRSIIVRNVRASVAAGKLVVTGENVVEIEHLSHRYGDRPALCDLSLRVGEGEIFGFLGPNGSGKTTLFRILCSLIAAPAGTVKMLGMDLAESRDEIRRHIGVVFQSPSLDKQLTPRENLWHQGHLYGLRGAELARRIDDLLGRMNLGDRAGERVERFSGGMRRRVELAKGMLNQPRILLLDEPSTGLDPAARIDLWRYLMEIQKNGVTVLLTTHLMDEADRCSRLAILDRGKLAACDTPAAMKERIGGDVITLMAREPARVGQIILDRFGLATERLDGVVRFERARGHEFIPQLIEALPGMIDSVSVGKPTLEDVFIQVTGRFFRDEPGSQ